MPPAKSPEGEGAPAPQHPNILRRISTAVDNGLTAFYRAEGGFCSRRPYTVILICCIITGACMVGFKKFEIEEDSETLYTPQNQPSFEDKAYFSENYKTTEESSKIFGLDVAQTGKNVLTKEHLKEHLRALNAVRNATVTVDGKAWTFHDRCVKVSSGDPSCKHDSILRFWGFDAARLEADNDIITTINNQSVLDYAGREPLYGLILGGITRQAGKVVAAEAFQTTLYFTVEEQFLSGDDEVLIAMLEEVVKLAYDDWESTVLKQYVSNAGAVNRESSKAITKDISRLTGGYILLIIYTIIVLWRNSWVYQKAHVAGASFLAIGFGIATSFGLLAGLGLKFNFVCQVLPFLLVGLGVDNTYIIIATYFDQDPDAPVPHRLSQSLSIGATSITVSSLTNVIAFIVGTYTSLQALFVFSIYASVGIFFIFLYQVTLFPALLALDARREVRMRSGKGCLGCAVPGTCVADEYQPLYGTGINGWTPESDDVKDPSAKAEPMTSPPGAQSAARPAASPADVELTVTRGAAADGAGPDKPTAPGAGRDYTSATIVSGCGRSPRFNPHDDQLSTKIVARWLPAVSLHPAGKAVIILLECVMLGFAIYGCTQVYMDFNFRELFVPKGNWLFEAFRIEERYFGGESTMADIYTRTALDGRDYFYYQNQLAAIKPALDASPYITDRPAPSSWYDDYLVWLNRDASPYKAQLVPSNWTTAGRTPPDAPRFNAWLKEWLRGDGSYAAPRVVWSIGLDSNNSTDTIISSRFTAFSTDVIDGSWAVKLVDATRKIADETAPDLQAFAFGFAYTFFDGLRVITWSTISNVIIAASAVFVVLLLLLADVIASLEVLLMVVLSDVGVLGSMHWYGLTFNSVTCIVIVLAVGIAVDYSAHVMRAFLVATGTRQERARAALREVGGAVWNGFFSTLLAIIMMSGAKHYIFTTIFRLFVALLVLAIWHGLVLLPVLLSWAGPPSYRDSAGGRGSSNAVVRLGSDLQKDDGKKQASEEV